MLIKFFLITTSIFLFIISFTSAIMVDAEYITIFSGEQEKINIEIKNNGNFDIKDVSMILVFENEGFIAIGSSEKTIDEFDEGDKEDISFIIKASNDLAPGDYNIGYKIKYLNAEEDNESFIKEGSFGLRVSVETELDFSAYTGNNAVVGKEGEIILEVINKGLGEIKSAIITITPDGYMLLSQEKIFLGSIDAGDSNIVDFDVVYKNTDAVFTAIIEYKDFNNQEQKEIIKIPLKVYTEEEALELGIINESNTILYIIIFLILIVIWIFYKRIKKNNKKKKREFQDSKNF